MEKLTNERILEILYINLQSVQAFAEGYYDTDDFEEAQLTTDLVEESYKKLFGEIIEIDESITHDGGELRKIYHFKDYDQYFSLGGRYSSYTANTWDRKFVEVFPKQGVVTKNLTNK